MTGIAPGSLSAIERHALALRVASLGGAAPIADAHRAELDWFGLDATTIAAIEGGDPAPALSPRLQALLAHASLLTVSPREAAPRHIAELRAAGLSTREIVAGLQLIAFLAFETRLLASLQHLGPPARGEA
jgi:uncharacterized protein YciW